jgi:hypothetical protein
MCKTTYGIIESSFMLRLSHFPTTWKFAQIIMIPKPGKPVNEVTSYRPIGLLPILSKISERLLLNGIRNDPEIKDIVPNHQFGFRQHHSTIHQTHRISNKIPTSMEKKTILHYSVFRHHPGF